MSFPLLLIDDDTRMLDALCRSLVLQFPVETATSGMLALERLEAGERFPVIVTDFRMPRMDGVQFIELARQICPETVFMVLTGNHESVDQDVLRDCPEVFLSISKPAKKCDLISAVEMAYGHYMKRRNQATSQEESQISTTNVHNSSGERTDETWGSESW